jgi:hypothetical protein
MDCNEKLNKININYYDYGKCGTVCGDDSDLSEPGLMFRPDLWEVDKEYQFGNGLYGRRFKGEVTEKPEIENIVLLANLGETVQVWECDGSWYHGNANIMLGGTAGNNIMSRLAVVDITTGYAKGDLILNTVSRWQRTKSPYDIWVKYTK